MSKETHLKTSSGNKAIAFRVRGTFSSSDLPAVLKSCLDIDHNPCIKSFAPQADENVNIATVTFETTPTQLLGSDHKTFDEQNVTFDTHFRGLSVLFSPEADQHHLDIIAICGLGGHAFGSFKERNGTHMWLRDSLPHDLKNARVLVYGYESRIQGSTSFQTLESLATSLRNHVEGIKPLSRSLYETPVIFIAHSLGGLVLKQALIQSVKAKSKLAHCTRGALFLGVPNQGMDVSSLMPMAAKQPNEAFLHSLQQESELLRSQNRDFSALFESREARIFCFYETETSPTAEKGLDGKWKMNGEHVILVSSASATHCRTWENEAHHVLGLDRDHSTLVKFKPGDEDYIKVRNVLQEIANDQYGLSRLKPLIPEVEQKLTDQCLKAMGHTNPIDTMRRIESTKDDLVAECSDWIKSDPRLKEWENDPQQRLLWLSGDPGKGKTMLMMSLVQEFRKARGRHLHTFFFCQNTDTRLNTAHAVMCGLLWLLVRENPILGHYLHEDYRQQKDFLDGPDAFVALCRIMTEILQHAALPTVYIMIDALDECDEGRSELLKFVGDNSTSAHSKAKWLVSSRNHLDIERGFKMRQHGVLSLELNASQITAAVEYFTKHKVDDLAKRNNYGDKLRERVQKHLIDNAQSTFLWVALACKHLYDTSKRNISTELSKLPAGLSSLYDRMLDQLRGGQDCELTTAIIKFVTIAKRPLLTQELLPLLVQEVPDNSDEPFEELIDNDDLLDLIKSCGSFITVRDGVIYLLHQSAKEYLVRQEGTKIFSPYMREEHCTVVDRSLLMLSKELMKHTYSHDHPRQEVHSDDLSLKSLNYISCFWVEHLAEYLDSGGTNEKVDFNRHESKVYEFILIYFFRWIELLCLLRQLKAARGILRRLETAATHYTAKEIRLLTHDANLFLTHSYRAIEQDPLQMYNFGLTFAPEESLVRQSFLRQALTSISMTPLGGGKKWGRLQQTLDGHEALVWSVAFSPDSQQLASASHDRTVRLWDATTGELLRTLQGHTRGIYSVSFSPDGRQLATASQDTTVLLWDTLSGDILWTLRGHTKRVLTTVFSSDGKKLASRSDDNTPRLWDTATGKLIQTFDGHTGPVWALDFSRDGKTLVTVSKDNTIRHWNIQTGEPSIVLYSHKSLFSLEVVSPNGQQIASASLSGRPTISLWNNSTHKQLWLDGHTGWVRKIAFSADSRQLASSGDDSTVRLWDTETGKCLQTFMGHSKHSTPIAFSPDGRRLAFSSADGAVQLWSLTTGKLLELLSKENACLYDRIKFLVFSPDCRKLALVSDQYSTQLWELATSEPLQLDERHADMISTIMFSQDGQQVFTVSEDETIRNWDAATGESLRTLKRHEGPFRSTAFSLDGSLLASVSDNSLIRIWDVARDISLQSFESTVRHLDDVVVSPNFRQMASWSKGSNSIILWNLATGTISRSLQGHTDGIMSLAFSSDSQCLASNSHDGTIRLWSTSTGENLRTLDEHGKCFGPVIFSPDGQKLAARSTDEIFLWNFTTEAFTRKVRPLERKDSQGEYHKRLGPGSDPGFPWFWKGTGGEYSLRFSPDGRELFFTQSGEIPEAEIVDWVLLHRWDFTKSASIKFRMKIDRNVIIAYSPDCQLCALTSPQCIGSIWLYETITGRVTTKLDGPRTSISSLAIDPNSKHIAAAGEHPDLIYVWNMVTGETVKRITGLNSTINLLAFSPNGQQLVSGSVGKSKPEDNAVSLWDLETGKPLWRIENCPPPTRAIAFSPDKRQLVSASDDTIVGLWDVMTGQMLQKFEGHTDQVLSVVFSPDGQQVVSGSKDGTIRIWDASAENSPRIIVGPQSPVKLVALSPDGQQLISWSENGTVFFWDLASRKVLRVFLQKSEIQFWHLVANGDDYEKIGFFFDGNTNWLSFNGCRLIWLPPEFRPRVSAVHGNRIAVGSQSGMVYILEADANSLVTSRQIQ